MIRNLFAVALCWAIVSQSALGNPLQLISGLPSSYVPGQAVSFDVALPNITNLGSYNIDFVLQSNVGTAGTDYYFDAAATLPASSHYVFPSSANYFDSVTLDSTTRDRITVTDFDLIGN
jgi:hypothetical protein